MGAALVYKLAWSIVAAAIVGAGIADVVLYLYEEQTISSWLRLHPAWFAAPVIAAMLFLFVLALHLFVWPDF